MVSISKSLWYKSGLSKTCEKTLSRKTFILVTIELMSERTEHENSVDETEDFDSKGLQRKQ